MNIRPNRSTILKEAALRSLNQGELVPGQPFKASQERGLKAFYDFLSNASDDFERRHGYFDMATGTGKTGLFALIARHAHRIAQEKGIGDTFKTLIVEPTVPLLKQTRKELIRVAPEVANSIGMAGGNNKLIDKPITIMTYSSWMELLESQQIDGSLIDLNINDESHYGLSVRRQSLVNEALSAAHHIGFTASSKYDAEKTMELTHRNLVYEIGLRQAVEEGMLAEYVHVQYAVMRLLPQDMNRPDLHLSNADFTFLRRREWSRFIVRAYAELNDNISDQPLYEKVALTFTADTKHADATAWEYNNNPILQRIAKERGFKQVAVAIHTRDSTRSMQDRLQEEFEAAEYMVAVGDKKFQAGFDYPRVKLVSSYPGSSAVDVVQEMGRATRPYVDPMTGESQGAVILETIPYIGDNDPKRDIQSRNIALRNAVTARDILGDALVLRSNYKSPAYTKKKSTSNSSPTLINLSPGCEVIVFTTEEDTVTISRQIDAAGDDGRIPVTKEMYAAFKEKLNDRGGIGARTILTYISEYEASKGLKPTDIKEQALAQLVGGSLLSFDEAQWIRVNEAVDSVVVVDGERRIPVDAATFKAKLGINEIFGTAKFYSELAKYEDKNSEQSVGLSREIINQIVIGRVKTIKLSHMRRIEAFLESRLNSSEPIAVTQKMSADLQGKVAARGNYRGNYLSSSLADYEAQNHLIPTNITAQIFDAILDGRKRFIAKDEWKRISEFVDTLPQIDRTKIDLTPQMRQDLERRLNERGIIQKRDVYRLIQKFEMDNDLDGVGIIEATLFSALRGDIKSMLVTQWKRLNDAIDSMPPVKDLFAQTPVGFVKRGGILPNVEDKARSTISELYPLLPADLFDQMVATVLEKMGVKQAFKEGRSVTEPVRKVEPQKKTQPKKFVSEPEIEPKEINSLSLLPSVWNALGLTRDEFVDVATGPYAQTISRMAIYAHGWANEAPKIKKDLNRAIRNLYLAVQPQINDMLAKQMNAEEISSRLNEIDAGRDTETGSLLVWEPNMLLRGAILTGEKLPLEIFLTGPVRTGVVQPNDSIKPPHP